MPKSEKDFDYDNMCYGKENTNIEKENNDSELTFDDLLFFDMID